MANKRKALKRLKKRIRELEERIAALEQEDRPNYAWSEMPRESESINVPGPEGLWRVAAREYAGYVWEDDESGYDEYHTGVYL